MADSYIFAGIFFLNYYAVLHKLICLVACI